MSEVTVEPFTVTVWAAFGAFVFGMIVGVLLVRSEAKRARRRWREAMRTWHEIDAVELRGEHNNLPRHNTAISGQAADQR